jgi:hypothetical protein
MSAQRGDSPQLRPANPFERRAALAIAAAKPALSHGSLISRTLPGGTALEVARRSSGRVSGPELPWTLRINGTIVPGTIGGIIPKIGDTPISGGPTIPDLFIPANGILVAELLFTLTWTAGYLSDPITLVHVKFDIRSSLPADDIDGGTFYRAFGFITAGLPSTRLFTNASLNWSLCGNSPNAATLTLT